MDIEKAYNKIDNLCCLNSNKEGFFDGYKESNDDDFCKDAHEMVEALETLRQCAMIVNFFKECNIIDVEEKPNWLHPFKRSSYTEDKKYILNVNKIELTKEGYDALKEVFNNGKEN